MRYAGTVHARLTALAFVFLGSLGAGACVVLDPSFGGCLTGSEACECTLGGGCDPGLECLAGICTDPDGPTTSEETQGTETDGTDETGTEPDPNVAFVTSQTWAPGDLGGLDGADQKCMDAAAAGGHEGTFVAWLSSGNGSAVERMQGAQGWVRPDGLVIADDLDALVRSDFRYPFNLDETGARIPNPGEELIVTATDEQGEFAGSNCNGFGNPSSATLVMVGHADYGDRGWTQLDMRSCDEPARLYCLQIDHADGVEHTRRDGRIAFITNATHPSTLGDVGFDFECELEAEAAGLGTQFKAAVATSVASPFDRVGLDDTDWIRSDGALLFVPGSAEFFTFPEMGPDESFNSGGDSAWLGASFPDETATAEKNCDDWMDPNHPGDARLVFLWNLVFTGGWWDGLNECAQHYRVLCVEQ